MKYEDLSPADRRAVRAAIGGGGAPTRHRDRTVAKGAAAVLVCHVCGLVPDTSVARDRHTVAARHYRWDLQLEPGAP